MTDTASSWQNVLDSAGSLNSYAQLVRERNEKINAFLEFDPQRGSSSAPAGDLKGMPFGVKDNIAVLGFKLSCGSRILEGLVSPYSATAVKRLESAGARVVGKTNLDEFGMGSSTENSAFGYSRNPWDLSRVTGGSSGGSAAAVAAGLVPFAIGSDTGGSIRQPAAFCGVYGLKPTYGAVSRYGLVAYASSLEVIGAVARTVTMTERVFHAMRGADPMDQTSMDAEEYYSGDAAAASAPTASAPTDPGKKPKRIGVLSGELGLTPQVARAHKTAVERLQKRGYQIVEIDLPMLEYVVPVYYTIATAEASANLARFNGVRYGLRPDYAENPDELVRIARDRGFGDEVKLRVLLGTYVLRSGFQDQYYLRAQKIRTAVRNELSQAFQSVDLILMPAFPTNAFKAGGVAAGESALDPFQQKVADRFTSTANLAGLPALSFPVSIEEGIPAGMQFMAPPFCEERLFRLGREMEEDFPAPEPPDYPSKWR
ncbi:Asp-tRNA(Asn)/Glu-tRNA(Gln) amidotransferase subunit GatA [Salinispira pacifica]